ncbi:DUF3788 family protein [Marinicella litoralis]|uniref:Uncharacterized protein DUF3788 n=1 Tax=Marinicella litoralis TaxID=644220 RepID=A0A4R6XQD9_9GAMM|nr:DUF3788 family protein [Marinicella litoralis]TDR18468.1 uncharacterized protein DUF3788 [Marinicella litoralis]
MNKRPFADKLIKPTEDSLNRILGKVYAIYLELNERTFGFKKSWRFSPSSGWMQKVHDGKKALYYLIPLNDSFSVSLAVQEKEKMRLLADQAILPMHEQLKNSKRYSEGYALRFSVDNLHSFLPCINLINKLAAMR